LWMMAPSVTASAPEEASAKARSTARLTPKQKPADFASTISGMGLLQKRGQPLGQDPVACPDLGRDMRRSDAQLRAGDDLPVPDGERRAPQPPALPLADDAGQDIPAGLGGDDHR